MRIAWALLHWLSLSHSHSASLVLGPPVHTGTNRRGCTQISVIYGAVSSYILGVMITFMSMMLFFFSPQRSAVGYWWVSVCTITYGWKEGEREETQGAIEMRGRYGCYRLIPWTIFHQRLYLETLLVIHKARASFLYSVYTSSIILPWALWLIPRWRDTREAEPPSGARGNGMWRNFRTGSTCTKTVNRGLPYINGHRHGKIMLEHWKVYYMNEGVYTLTGHFVRYTCSTAR